MSISPPIAHRIGMEQAKYSNHFSIPSRRLNIQNTGSRTINTGYNRVSKNVRYCIQYVSLGGFYLAVVSFATSTNASSNFFSIIFRTLLLNSMVRGCSATFCVAYAPTMMYAVRSLGINALMNNDDVTAITHRIIHRFIKTSRDTPDFRPGR